MPTLVGRALEAVCSDSLSADRYARAAAGAILLAWIQGGELAFHPHDPGHITISYGAPPALVELMDAYPELDQEWRKAMAAQRLAYWIAAGLDLENDPTKAMNGLVAIASSVGEKSSHHPDAGLVSGDSLAELALIATGAA